MLLVIAVAAATVSLILMLPMILNTLDQLFKTYFVPYIEPTQEKQPTEDDPALMAHVARQIEDHHNSDD